MLTGRSFPIAIIALLLVAEAPARMLAQEPDTELNMAQTLEMESARFARACILFSRDPSQPEIDRIARFVRRHRISNTVTIPPAGVIGYEVCGELNSLETAYKLAKRFRGLHLRGASIRVVPPTAD